ncbi:MAG: aminoacyl-tRNA hydrolase [Clostridia bacterium]|nr:aminoacyl-tRNA hydrolase [Clostridia bacterium]
MSISIFSKIFGKNKDGSGSETFIVAGLGNPGSRYENTRHNCGFKVADVLAERLGISVSKRKFHAMYGDKKIDAGGREIRVVLMKPETYMNNSGVAVSEAAAFYKVPAERIIVIYDDADISLGEIRVRRGGGPGTHNGMESVVDHLGKEDFPRIRVGIGSRMPNEDMVGFVLGRFPPEQEPVIEKSFEKAADAAVIIMRDGAEAAMAKVNGKAGRT